MILITSADSYMGHCIASHLARHTDLVPHIRVLCSTNLKSCLHFFRKGIDLYTDMDQAMQGVDTVIMSIDDAHDRIDYYRKLCLAAAHHGVKSVVCVSHVGAAGPLEDFAAIEDHLITTAENNYQWTILRPDWILQHFFLWATPVDQDACLSLPLPTHAEFSPIDIADVCSVVESLVLDAKTHTILPITDDHIHNGQVYILTGPELITVKDVVNSLSKANTAPGVTQQFVRLMDTKYFLENLKDNIWFDARIKHERHLTYYDPLDHTLAYSARWVTPNQTLIDTIILYLDWIRTTAASIQVPHANIILSRPLVSIDNFFQTHAKAFQAHK